MSTFHSSVGRMLCMGVLAAAGTAMAYAQTDLGAIEVNKRYDLTGKTSPITATFTPAVSETVTCSGGDFAWYSDNSYAQDKEVHGSFTSDSNNGGSYTYNVTAGTTYYLRAAYLLSTTYLEVTGTSASGETQGLSLTSAVPAEGSTIGMATEMITLKYSGAVKACTATLTVGSNPALTLTPGMQQAGSGYVTLPVGEALKPLYEGNQIKAGDAISIAVSATPQSGDALASTLAYVAADKAVTLVDYRKPATFYSYMPVDDNSKIVLTFSGDISGMESCDLGFGKLETEGAYYNEKLTPVISGNTVTVELGGKNRRIANMVTIPDAAYNKDITVKFSGIKDINGNYIYTGGQGSIGSIAYTMPYEELPAADISSELTINGNEAELYIVNEKSISYTGVRLTYIGNSRSDYDQVITTLIPLSEVRKEYESIDGTEQPNASLFFTIPASYLSAQDLIITLEELQSADGLDYRIQTTAHHNTLPGLTFTPGEGTAYEEIPADLPLSATFDNMSTEVDVPASSTDARVEKDNYVVFRVRDLNPDNAEEPWAVDAVTLHYNATSGKYEGNVARAFKLYSDHGYRAEVYAYQNEQAYWDYADPIGRASFYWIGKSAPYKYADAEFFNIIPEPGFELDGKADQVFTATYTDMVRIEAGYATGMGGGVASANDIVPAPGDDNQVTEIDGVKYAKIWNFTFTASQIKNCGNSLALVLKAWDTEGRVVKGNAGLKDNSMESIAYPVTANNFDAECNIADGADLDSFSGIILTYKDKVIDQTYTATEAVKLYKNKNEFVCELAFKADPHYYDEGYENKACEYAPYNAETWKFYEITEPGSYTVVVPRSLVRIGEQFDTQDNNRMVINFTIKGGAPDTEMAELTIVSTGVPETGAEELGDVTVKFEQQVYPDPTYTHNPTIAFDGGEAKNVNWEIGYDNPDDFSSTDAHAVTFHCGGLTATGDYVITVPDGMLCADENGTKPYKGFTLTYKVSSVGSIAIDSADAEVYTISGLRMTGRDLTPGIYIVRRADGQTLKVTVK